MSFVEGLPPRRFVEPGLNVESLLQWIASGEFAEALIRDGLVPNTRAAAKTVAAPAPKAPILADRANDFVGNLVVAA